MASAIITAIVIDILIREIITIYIKILKRKRRSIRNGKEEDKLRPDKVDTNGDSKSVYLLQSISSKEAYLTYITGNISYLNG
ncbi:unnamed protein product [Fusarium fujikuroi]|nr:unnamed protein product [Fusarium fujikuroi]